LPAGSRREQAKSVTAPVIKLATRIRLRTPVACPRQRANWTFLFRNDVKPKVANRMFIDSVSCPVA
jgi:hypothetical protein